MTDEVLTVKQKIKELEKALSEEKAEHGKTREGMEMLEANKGMLDKHVKEIDKICSESCDYAEELEKEIKELHKLLIKEWE